MLFRSVIAVHVQHIRLIGVDELCKVVLKNCAATHIRPNRAADNFDIVLLLIFPVARLNIVSAEKACEIIRYFIKLLRNDNRLVPHFRKILCQNVYFISRVRVKKAFKLNNPHRFSPSEPRNRLSPYSKYRDRFSHTPHTSTPTRSAHAQAQKPLPQAGY